MLFRDRFKREYTIWREMRRRCYDSGRKDFKNYGAKGITVCDRWMKSFELFVKDMGACPAGFSIDRKLNHLGYFPENCRWASQETQSNNKTTSVFLTLSGVTQTVTQWARHFGVTDDAIKYRIKNKIPLTLPFKKANQS